MARMKQVRVGNGMEVSVVPIAPRLLERHSARTRRSFQGR